MTSEILAQTELYQALRNENQRITIHPRSNFRAGAMFPFPRDSSSDFKNMVGQITNEKTAALNEIFPLRVCINLDRRPDRWQRMQHESARHGIHSVRRFSALDGNTLELPHNWIHSPGAYGCLLSHLQVIRDARQSGVSSVLILEDDAVFDPELQEKFGVFFNEVPPDWDMLFLGALHKDEPIKIADHVGRITKANSTYAYAVKNTVFHDFIELNRRAEHVLDMNSFILQQRFNCYCFLPNLAWVQTEYSDVQNRLERHWYLEKSLVLFGAQVDRLLNDTIIVFAHHEPAPNGRATANLRFLLHYYDEFFSPLIDMVVVEQGATPSIDSEDLPANCKYLFLPDGGPFDRERCFNTGIAGAGPEKRFVILSENDLYLETLDLRANLRMCEEYEAATGYSEVIDLTQEQAQRLRETRITRGIDITKNSPSRHDGVLSRCCFFNRKALERAGGWSEGRLEQMADDLLSLQARKNRVFQSPNHALRLPKD